MTPQELWALPNDEFNLWREKNDLPKLFDAFNKNLPGFSDWLIENNFEIETLIKMRNPGELFHGENDKYIIEFPENHIDTRYYFIDPSSKRSAKEVEKIAKEKKHPYQRYTPYILWGRRKFKNKNFLPGKTRTLQYSTGMATESPEHCQWQISSGPYVLRLGGITITRGQRLNGRNLDFTNLDFLRVEDQDHGNTLHSIFFAHCHNITLNSGKLSGLNFIECNFQNLALENDSDIYACYFHNGNIWGLKS